MKIAVRYYTRTGNTEKLAKAIAKAVGVNAENVTVPLGEQVDILFLGSSYYAFDVDPAIKDFLKNNNANIGKIVNFGTAAMMGSTTKQIKKVADECGVAVADEEFHCRGSFGPMHKGRPNDDDLNKAKAFAKSVCG